MNRYMTETEKMLNHLSQGNPALFLTEPERAALETAARVILAERHSEALASALQKLVSVKTL